MGAYDSVAVFNARGDRRGAGSTFFGEAGKATVPIGGGDGNSVTSKYSISRDAESVLRSRGEVRRDLTVNFALAFEDVFAVAEDGSLNTFKSLEDRNVNGGRFEVCPSS